MSMPRGMKIVCPDCKTEDNFTIWHTINVDVNPETRDKVKSGKLFEHTCSKCKKTFSVEYRFLYHDCSNRFMIWYFPKHEYDINKEILEINKLDFINKYNETLRIVDDKRRLIEKISIFEDRLNDFGIEMMKNIILNQLEDKSIEVFYNKIEDGMIHFWLSNNKGAAIQYSTYNDILSNYIFEDRKDCIIIDGNNVYKYGKNKNES